MNEAAFAQNTIAIIWDFDQTLIPGYMQDPLFRAYGVDGSTFWAEVRELESYYERRGVRVNRDTLYLNHILTYVKEGIFYDLSNARLRELGGELTFYPGLPEFFQRIAHRVEQDERFSRFGVSVEHYVVSTGLAEMIRGSAIYPYLKGVWGCEFIEEPAGPGFLRNMERGPMDQAAGDSVIRQIAYAIDNTSKTRALFEINKGANVHPEIDVNASMREESRRVPFSYMIYVADGPSDVPAFSILNQSGGKTYAVYPSGNMDAFRQVDALRNDGRVQMFGEANYTETSQTAMWLFSHVTQMAEAIARKKEEAIRNSVSRPPQHIV